MLDGGVHPMIEDYNYIAVEAGSHVSPRYKLVAGSATVSNTEQHSRQVPVEFLKGAGSVGIHHFDQQRRLDGDPCAQSSENQVTFGFSATRASTTRSAAKTVAYVAFERSRLWQWPGSLRLWCHRKGDLGQLFHVQTRQLRCDVSEPDLHFAHVWLRRR